MNQVNVTTLKKYSWKTDQKKHQIEEFRAFYYVYKITLIEWFRLRFMLVWSQKKYEENIKLPTVPHSIDDKVVLSNSFKNVTN